MMISVIITTRNEEYNLPDLLDSLVVQEKPFEIIIIDSGSTDKTVPIAQKYSKRYPEVKLLHFAGTRGDSRNYGVKRAKGDAVAFIDGDCIANPFWLKEFRKSLKNQKIVAGKTINLGYQAFVQLDRVELFHKGVDLTFPSCNLVYDSKLFKKVKGFDSRFVTAEDIDLNYRAINAGAGLEYNEKAVVYHRVRSTFYAFCRQAFWNGFGRKQLTMKHGRLWQNYNLSLMFKHRVRLWYLIRMVIALMGYMTCKLFKGGKFAAQTS
ncbi:MAG: glycosyltransferase [Thermoplasmata archaeon]|nr:MAG: glycosyltransferase [Thermoplasmata archaeon]